MSIRAAIFDLDGTSADTLNDIAGAMNRSLRLHGLPEHPVADYRYMVGNGIKTLAVRAVGERRELAQAVQAEYQRYYSAHALDTAAPYPGIAELLRALVRADIAVCVLSNKPHPDTCAVIRHFFPDVPFAVVRGQLPEVPVKPDPTGAQLIAQELGLAPEVCVYLGDTSVDMRTAVAAGMHPVGVTWGFRTPEELTRSGAARLIAHPMELMDFVTLL